MKKKIALLLASAMAVASLSTTAMAEDYTKVNLNVNGTALETDQPAVIVNSRTMVPFRAIAEKLGCEVEWNAETKSVTFNKGVGSVEFTIGSNDVKVSLGSNTTTVAVDSPAIIINSRTMVPVRFISETVGYEVAWDAVTKTVDITDGKDVVESSSAVEVASGAAVETEDDTVTVEKVKALADEISVVCTKLNASSDAMTEKEINDYLEYNNMVAQVAGTVGTEDMDEENELVAGMKMLETAANGIKTIAKNNGVAID